MSNPNRASTSSPNPMPHTLWDVTDGQRLHYLGATLVMGLSNLFMYAVPLIVKHAIDVMMQLDLTVGLPMIVGFIQPDRENAIIIYLCLSAGMALCTTAIGGLCYFISGRWTAIASEAIIRRVRNHLFSHK